MVYEHGRREFLKSVGCFCVLGGTGCGCLSRYGLGRGGRRLRFGAMSDVHVWCESGWGDTSIFEQTLRRMGEAGCDGVVIAGDISEWGLVKHLELAGAAWRKVFPGDRRADGGRVEKLFTLGNHDLEGFAYGESVRAKHPDWFAKENLIVTDLAAAWRKAFDEDYAPIWMKTVNGYRFVGCNTFAYPKDATFLEDNRAELEGTRPFFYVQHAHPKGTTASPWVWGQDDGHSTRALSRFPNAVALSGHSHTPLTDDRVLWQGAFTSVGTASLRYLIPIGGRENTRVCGAEDPMPSQMPAIGSGARHYQIVTAYDDALVFQRMDYASGKPLGPDWVVPLPFDGSMSFARRAAREEAPAFAPDAKVAVARDEKGRIVVSFPPALRPVRAYDYEVTLEVKDVDAVRPHRVKRVFSPVFHRPPEVETLPVTCVFAEDDVPKQYRVAGGWGEPGPLSADRGRSYRFLVRPCACFGAKGEAVATEWTFE